MCLTPHTSYWQLHCSCRYGSCTAAVQQLTIVAASCIYIISCNIYCSHRSYDRRKLCYFETPTSDLQFAWVDPRGTPFLKKKLKKGSCAARLHASRFKVRYQGFKIAQLPAIMGLVKAKNITWYDVSTWGRDKFQLLQLRCSCRNGSNTVAANRMCVVW